MPNDAFTQQALANDPTFRQRVKASLSRIARQVLTEAPATTGHATRAAYARAFLANPDNVVANLTQSLVFATNINSTTTSAGFNGIGGTQVTSAVTDAALDSQLATDWDSLAGV